MTQENVGTKTTTPPSSTSAVAFVLSLIGGVLISIGSVTGMALGWMGRPFFWGMGGMMGNYYPYMMNGLYYGNYGMMYGFEFVGLITGVLVIVFALLMRSKPADRKTYGILILMFSLISFVGMGGFFIGAILGIIGGILAITGT